MNFVRRIFRWGMFILRTGGMKPEYPFVDDFRDKPLELHIGPWGSIQWFNSTNGEYYNVTVTDDLALIAEDLERSQYGQTYREYAGDVLYDIQERNKRFAELKKQSPMACLIDYNAILRSPYKNSFKK